MGCGATWVSLQGWGGRGKLGFPTWLGKTWFPYVIYIFCGCSKYIELTIFIKYEKFDLVYPFLC